MIYTFYSYKGGVGRSMALANVAELLYQDGLNVLMVDWDLEAPGLERYFPPLVNKVLEHLGVMDMLQDYKQRMAQPSLQGSEEKPLPFPDINQYVVEIYSGERGKGRLWLLPAGRRVGEDFERYAHLVSTFNWQDFYQNWEGELFFEWVRNQLLKLADVVFDVVLIDSRTGVTEIGGVCTYQLADVVVMFGSASQQSLEGTFEMARNFMNPEVKVLRHDRPLQVLIVPARVDDRAQIEDLNEFKEDFLQKFHDFLPSTNPGDQDPFERLKIPHVPKYALKELVAVRETGRARSEDMVRAFATLAQEMAKLAPSDSVLQQVVLKRKKPSYDVFFSYQQGDRILVESLAQKMRDEARFEIFMDTWEIAPGDPWAEELKGALERSRTCAAFIGSEGLSSRQLDDLKSAVEQRDLRVVPVLLPGADPSHLPRFLASRSWVDFRAGLDDPQAFRSLVRGLQEKAPRGPSAEEIRPYRGLLPFYEEHSQFFFGRQRFIELLLDSLRRNRLIAVIGPSGSGKSSLVQGGLIPALRTNALPASASWPVAVFRPGDKPFTTMAASLLPLLERKTAGSEQLQDTSGLANALAQGSMRLGEVVTQVLTGQSTPSRVLMIVDQFEELYALCPDKTIQRRFLDELLDATANSLLIVVLTIRTEAYGQVLAYRPFADALKEATLNLGPMTREEVIRGIEEPARRVGLKFEQGLVDRIVADISQEPGNLPLLQSVLVELWNRRRDGQLTNEAYDYIGGVLGVVARQAEAAYEKMKREEQGIARRIFVRLVQLGEGTKGTRCQATLAELGEPENAVRAVTRILTDARLIVMGWDEARGEEIAEIAHEALIRSWGRLRGWMDEDREFLLWRQKLRSYIADWEGNRRDPGALLSGAPLKVADSWRHERAKDLNEFELSYIKASNRIHLRKAIARPFVTITVILWLSYLGWQAWKFDALVIGADSLARIGKTDLALTLYSRAIQIDPKGAPAYVKRGILYNEKKEYRNALADFSQAIGLDSTSPTAYFNRGLAFEVSGAVDPAISDYTSAIELKKDNAEAYFRRGLAYMSKGEKEQAITDFNLVLSINPDPSTVQAAREKVQQLRSPPPARDTPKVYLRYRDRKDLPVLKSIEKALTDSKRFDVGDTVPVSTPTDGDVRYFYKDDEKAAEEIRKLVESTLAREGIKISLKLFPRDPTTSQKAQPARGQIEVWIPSLSRRLPSRSASQERLEASKSTPGQLEKLPHESQKK